MADNRVVEQLVAWLDVHRPYKFTGHTSTARNARVKDVWVRFHSDLAVWWFATFRYAPEAGKSAGAKGPAWDLFKAALPIALRIQRARDDGVALDDVEPVEYIIRTGESTIRAIKGFMPAGVVATGVADAAGAAFEVADAANEAVADADAGAAVDVAGTADATGAVNADAGAVEPAGAAGAPTSVAKRVYLCTHCKQPKKGHTCPHRAGRKRQLAEQVDPSKRRRTRSMDGA